MLTTLAITLYGRHGGIGWQQLMPIAEPEGPREPSPKALMGVKEHIEAVGERRVVNMGRGMGQSLGEMDRPLCEFPYCNV
jgi:hypothetical protein